MGTDTPAPDDDRVARALLSKLRAFAVTLDPDERELFAALVGPGIGRALGDDEVEGFAFEGPEADRLARGLSESYRRGTGSHETG